jgi:hypothetical protein
MMRRNLFALLLIGLMMVPGGVAEEGDTAGDSSCTNPDESACDGAACALYGTVCTCKASGHDYSPVYADADLSHPSVMVGPPAVATGQGIMVDGYGPYYTFDASGCA